MAKFERTITGDFNEVLAFCEDSIKRGSMSATYEDGSYYELSGVKVATQVYERYSAFGGNRVSLSITLIGDRNDLYLTAITSGGSQAMFFKINTLGESSFLDTLAHAINSRYPHGHR